MIDAVVVGAGPNGLAAAVTLARAGLQVRLYEQSDHIGGGASTQELTLPGFHHDVCSAVHPLAFMSSFFRNFGLRDRVEFVTPELSFAQPLDNGRAALAYRDLARTRDALGIDGPAYERLLRPLVERVDAIAEFTGSSMVRMPADPVAAMLLALRSIEQGSPLWNTRFKADAAPALITGAAAHSILRQPGLAAAGAGLVLATYAHAGGWPIPVGGSQAIVNALAADFVAHGGEIVTGHGIASIEELPRARATLLNVTPRAFVAMARSTMPAQYRRVLESFKYGSGAAKVDFALSDPVPWQNAQLAAAGTLHLGGSRQEMLTAENEVLRGKMPGNPYVLVAQQSVFDQTRAPAGRHTLWAYTHVPAGSNHNRQEAVIAQIERFAPGFRDTILATSSRSAADLEQHNPNYIGGDIGAGASSFAQLLRRPVFGGDPWRTPIPGVYLASASTSPGPGVHGLGGWHAARSALRHSFGQLTPPDLAPRWRGSR